MEVGFGVSLFSVSVPLELGSLHAVFLSESD